MPLLHIASFAFYYISLGVFLNVLSKCSKMSLFEQIFGHFTPKILPPTPDLMGARLLIKSSLWMSIALRCPPSPKCAPLATLR